MTDQQEDNKPLEGADDFPLGRIEGGIDAIVIGANADGLAVATFLAKRRLKTVLIDAASEVGGALQRFTFGADHSGIDGDGLVTHLDPDMIEELDLYRFGLEYDARRLDTTYFFDDGSSLSVDGDIRAAGAVLDVGDHDKAAFKEFIDELLETSDQYSGLRRWQLRSAAKVMAPGKRDAANADAKIVNSKSAASMIDRRFQDERLEAVFQSEAAFFAGVEPSAPYSAWSLLEVFSGETAGLKGARGYPNDGCRGVIDALRRAAQEAGVVIRMLTPARSILIEADRVAGVELEKGGQLRAPIVISALDAKTTFGKLIGPARLDISFQHDARALRASVMPAQFNAVLKGAPSDVETADLMKRRLVFAPAPSLLEAAFIDARRGRMPNTLCVEVIFPGALKDGAAMAQPQLLVRAHPFPFADTPDDAFRKEVRENILAVLEKFIPGVGELIVASELRLANDFADSAGAPANIFAYGATPIESLSQMMSFSAASFIRGFYFCGAEMKIGNGLSLTAARLAAKRAIEDYRKGRVAS